MSKKRRIPKRQIYMEKKEATVNAVKNGEISVESAAKLTGMTPETIKRWAAGDISKQAYIARVDGTGMADNAQAVSYSYDDAVGFITDNWRGIMDIARVFGVITSNPKRFTDRTVYKAETPEEQIALLAKQLKYQGNTIEAIQNLIIKVLGDA